MTGTAVSSLRRFSPRSRARVRLVCFPHAGGAATAYRLWALDAPWDVEVCAVQYPGRGDRFDEEPEATMDGLVSGLAADLLRERSPVATVLFGHSMGASVAYETARRLARLGLGPAALLVSGQPAPQLSRAGALHDAPDGELLADLGRLEGTSRDVLEDQALLAALLPAIRSDYRVIETYRPEAGVRLRIPVTVIRAADDPEVTAAEAAGWREVTDGPCDQLVFPAGGHFYLHEQRERVLAALVERARSICALTGSAWPLMP
ncbi:thioesterase II family protein [Kitasatospora sp. NPDC048286]|uniref:thioesterase II family protein n=1 Tax=Kitasatospora sp. NPDC048286 TaxID=3364047 RepID=UPI00371BD35B